MKKISLLSLIVFSLVFSFLPTGNFFIQAVDPVQQCISDLMGTGSCTSTEKCTQDDLLTTERVDDEGEVHKGSIGWYCDSLTDDQKNTVVAGIKSAGLFTLSAPPAPTELSPPNASIVSSPVVLKWQAVPGATKYKYQFSPRNDYTGQSISEISNNQVSLLLEYNTSYRWRVQSCVTDKAANIDFCSDWAEQTFTTANVSGGGSSGSSGGQSQTSPGGATPILGLPNPLGEGATFETVLDKIINFIFWIGMAVAPVMIIVAGFLYVTSAGNPQKVEQAKKIIIYAVIGLVVLLLARGLVKVLESVIGTTNS